MSHFLRLPPEIRNSIYKYCLIVDYPIAPYLSTYELCILAVHDREIKKGKRKPVSKPELPAVSIIQVSKQLHLEASPILYGQNHWKHPQCWSNYECSKSIFDYHEAFFRKIEVSFDWREGSFRNIY